MSVYTRTHFKSLYNSTRSCHKASKEVKRLLPGVYSNICNKHRAKHPSNNLNHRHYVHFPFGSKNLSADCDWHLCQKMVYGKTFKESVSSSSSLITKQPQCPQRKFSCGSTPFKLEHLGKMGSPFPL